ncbi:MAG: hypothetical protein NC191_00435 [Muribaculaceae bacterium]|nr:hypothetical protein [Muribaculaceae bacterium]
MRFLLTLCLLLFIILPVNAKNYGLANENTIQCRIDKVGTNILNKNKITKRIIFTYDKREKKKILSADKTLSNRQVVIYDGLYQSVKTDDELAAMLSREISTALKGYKGKNGTVSSIQVSLGAKKFEIAADKAAVDFMVNSGYNPLALIVFINNLSAKKIRQIFKT